MVWRNVALAIVGAWFVVSAWALRPMHDTTLWMWTAIILGGLVLIGSVWALGERRPRAWRGIVLAVFGLYLGLTPFFYSFAFNAAALWITMVTGAIILAGGIWNAASRSGAARVDTAHRAA